MIIKTPYTPYSMYLKGTIGSKGVCSIEGRQGAAKLWKLPSPECEQKADTRRALESSSPWHPQHAKAEL